MLAVSPQSPPQRGAPQALKPQPLGPGAPARPARGCCEGGGGSPHLTKCLSSGPTRFRDCASGGRRAGSRAAPAGRAWTWLPSPQGHVAVLSSRPEGPPHFRLWRQALDLLRTRASTLGCGGAHRQATPTTDHRPPPNRAHHRATPIAEHHPSPSHAHRRTTPITSKGCNGPILRKDPQRPVSWALVGQVGGDPGALTPPPVLPRHFPPTCSPGPWPDHPGQTISWKLGA